MTSITPENFFDNVGQGGANFGPSALLSAVGDWVKGTIVDQRVTDVKKFNGKDGEVEVNRDGSTKQQLVLSLQTEFRNWQGVKPANVPWVDYKDQSKGRVPANEDTGLRAVYLPQWSNIQDAVAQATRPVYDGRPGPVLNGGELGVKVIEHKDTGKGNPLKIHAAVYTPPAPAPASQDFFAGTATGTPVEDVINRSPATAPEAQRGEPAQDPWSGQPSGGAAAPKQQAEEPPF